MAKKKSNTIVLSIKEWMITLLILSSLSIYAQHVSKDIPVSEVKIANWKGNKKAALSLQFDDCTPGQATLGVPALIRRNLTGTWFVNPGKDEYKKNVNIWEIIAPAGGQELANHTMNHSGAGNYAQTVYEVGEASKIIWRIRNQKDFGSLIAFNRGGGTSWNEEDLKKVLVDYCNIDRIANAGVKVDSKTIMPGSTVSKMLETVPKIINEGLWGRLQFHGISSVNGNPPKDYGNGAVFIKEFETFLDSLTKLTDNLWIGGYIQIYKYIMERKNTNLIVNMVDDNHIRIRVQSNLEPKLYDEPITLMIKVPAGWKKCNINHNGNKVKVVLKDQIVFYDYKPNTGDIILEKQ